MMRFRRFLGFGSGDSSSDDEWISPKLDEEPNHDPQEDDPVLGPIIKRAAREADRQVRGNKPLCLGQHHATWKRQKEILKAQGIDWKTPTEMNLYTRYD
jgi:hypothetical protein